MLAVRDLIRMRLIRITPPEAFLIVCVSVQSLFWEQVKAIGDVPAPRSGHSFTKVGTRYLLFGGMGCQSELCGDSLSKLKLQKTRCYCRRSLLLLMFADGKAQAFNDIYEFEPGDDESKWTLISAVNPPAARARHAAFALDDENLLIFGGVNKRDRYDDLCVYNCPSKTWSNVQAQGYSHVSESGVTAVIRPGPRAHFTAAKATNQIFIFGGYGGAGIVYGDLWVLHVEVGGEADFSFRYDLHFFVSYCLC